MHVSLQQTLTHRALTRQTAAPYFRAWMDAMIALVRSWTVVDCIAGARWAV